MQELFLNKRYQLLGYLGRGGMGVVYKAADRLLGNRLVAIKEMTHSHLSQEEIASITTAFRQEALLLASLSHQNLPRIFDHFSEHGNLYLVMEYINGDTLGDVLQQADGQGLLLEEVLLIAEQLCSVLDYLHAHQPPIIFRDLKPGNVMITGDHLYLIDFGIARLFKPEKLQDTLVSGTRGYAPPEQYVGATTERSDIYSFGATLHQLLTGIDPSRSMDSFYFPSISSLNPQVPLSLEKLITQMVQKDPEKRPPSISVVKRELQRMKQELQRGSLTSFHVTTGKIVVPTLPETARGTPLHSFQNHKDTVQALAWSPDGKYLATGGRDKQVHVWDIASGNKIFTYSRHPTYVYSLAWSPDGKRIVSTSFATVHVWDALTGDNVVTYHDHSLWVYTSAWSADGQYIATGGAEGEVHFWTDFSGANIYKYRATSRVVKAVAWSPVAGSAKIVAGCEDAAAHSWNTTTGNAPLIYSGHAKEVTSVACAPDDHQIASGSRDRTVQIWDACTGKTLFTYRGHVKEIYIVAWSPDGKFIASAGEDKCIHLWDAATGRTAYTHQCHKGAVYGLAWSPDGKLLASAGDDTIVYVWQAS